MVHTGTVNLVTYSYRTKQSMKAGSAKIVKDFDYESCLRYKKGEISSPTVILPIMQIYIITSFTYRPTFASSMAIVLGTRRWSFRRV